MDLVASSEQVGDSLWWWLVRNGRADNVGNVAPILLGWNLQLGVRVETPDSCKMHISAKNGYTSRVLLREVLQHLDELATLRLMLARCVVVVQIVEQIDLAIELVEETASKSKALIQEFDRRDERRLQDVLKPDQTWICDGYTEQQHQVLQVCVRRKLLVEAIKEHLVRLGVVDLMSCSLRSCINTSKGDARAQLTVNAATAFFDIWAGLSSNEIRWVAHIIRHDKSILQLHGICRCCAFDAHAGRLRRVGCEGALRGSEMVLKEEVVFVRDTTDSSEDGALHEVVGVGAESVDDVVIVPDVHLSNLAVGSRERLLAIPPDVVVEVVLVAVGAHLLAEGVFASFVGARDVRPRLQRAIHSDSVIVDLITSSNHDVKRSLLVHAQDIVPERRAGPSVNISANTEAVARVKHDAHRLGDGRDDEVLRLLKSLMVDVNQVLDIVAPSRLELLERSLDDEAPEGSLRILVQLLSAEGPGLDSKPDIGSILSDWAGRRQYKLRALLARRGDDQHAAMPHRLARLLVAGAPVVEQRSSDDIQRIRGADDLGSLSNANNTAGILMGLEVFRHRAFRTRPILVSGEGGD